MVRFRDVHVDLRSTFQTLTPHFVTLVVFSDPFGASELRPITLTYQGSHPQTLLLLLSRNLS